LDTLAAYAHKLGGIVQGIEGAEDLYVEAVTGMPQIVIEYNRSAISQYGLTINHVNDVINAAFSGRSAGLVYEGEKRFDLVVRMDKSERTDVTDVQNLLIPTANGTQVPLNMLAKVDIVEGPNQIQRENTKRRIVVGFNARGRDVQSLMEELGSKVDAKIKFPSGYTVEYGGSFKNLEQAKQRLSIAVPLALLMIFFLLYFAFKSVKQGLLIFTAIPLSAIGGIFALYILGLPFSISAGVGFIALFGVAVLNGIVLVAEFNRLKAEGMKDLRRIVLMGTKIRMRPVLMTAFVASLGFLPMAMSHGAGAEVQRPLASVVIGGLLLATFLTLFVLPILYVIFTNAKEVNLNKKGIYSNRKKLQTQEANKSEINVALKTADLKRNVSKVFYNLVNLEEKKILLLKIDSIYASYLEKANLRIQLGESNILEKSTIDYQRLQIGHQLNQLNADIEIEQLHFQYLLNTTTQFIPETKSIIVQLNGQMDKSLLAKHPNLQLLEADIKLAQSMVQLEKSKQNPNLQLALTSGTIYGTGADNKDYNYSTRFNSAQVGVGIPLFTNQRQNVKAAQINTELASNTLQIETQNLENQLDVLVKRYEVQKQIVKELEDQALPNSKLIFETAQKQFVNGDINYLDWAMLVNQSISIQSNYQDAILKLNESAIELTYLLNGN